MYTAGVLEQAQSDGMDGRVPPPLVEEAAGAVQVVEVILVRLAAPELHVGDLEVAPEMAGRVAVGLFVVAGAALLILEPGAGGDGLVPDVLWVGLDEFERLGPEGGDGLGRVVQVDGEAVRLVVIVHVAEDVVVDVAKEVHVGLDAPVVARVFEGRVVVEEAAVPAAHLVVGDHVAVLDVLLGQYLGAFPEEVVVDPGGHGPVLLGDELVVAWGVGFGAGAFFELGGEGLVVEEGPGVVELAVPGPFEVAHGLHHAVDFRVADQGENGCVDAGGIRVIRGVVVGGSPELASGLVGFLRSVSLKSS